MRALARGLFCIGALAWLTGLPVLAQTSPETGAPREGPRIEAEKGVGAVLSDSVLQARINAALLQASGSLFLRTDLTVSEGRVLLTGIVGNEATRNEATRVVWTVDGVRQVINELQVGEPRSVGEAGRDELIIGELRAKITADAGIESVNYVIKSVNRRVYLIGIAQDEAELDLVLAAAKDVPYVKRVISHVLLTDDPRRPEHAEGADD